MTTTTECRCVRNQSCHTQCTCECHMPHACIYYRIWREIDPNSTPTEWELMIHLDTAPEVTRWLCEIKGILSFYGRRLKIITPDGQEWMPVEWMYSRPDAELLSQETDHA